MVVHHRASALLALLLTVAVVLSACGGATPAPAPLRLLPPKLLRLKPLRLKPPHAAKFDKHLVEARLGVHSKSLRTPWP